jgi:hypothetical protein
MTATIHATADEYARDAAAEAAQAAHRARLRTDHAYALQCLRDALDSVEALRDAAQRAVVVCSEGRQEECAGHRGAALGALVAIAGVLNGVLDEVRS